MQSNQVQFDRVVFIDHRALTQVPLDFLAKFDFTKTTLHIVSRELVRLNEYFKQLEVTEETSSLIKDRLPQLSKMFSEGKIRCLGAQDEDLTSRLMELLLKKYYRQNIMFVTNDEAQAKRFLPFVPVFEAFGQTFRVISLLDEPKAYDFEEYDAAMEKCGASQTATLTEGREEKPQEEPKEEQGEDMHTNAEVQAENASEEGKEGASKEEQAEIAPEGEADQGDVVSAEQAESAPSAQTEQAGGNDIEDEFNF